MKRKEFLKEIDELSAEALTERIESLSEELMKLRFRKAAGQLEQSHRVAQVRRMLSRAMTRERQKRSQAGV
jgi:large subunit ribosomal protein L29